MRGQWQRFKDSYLWYSFKRDRVAMVSCAVFVFLFVSAVLAPWISPYNPYDPANIDILASETPPMWMEGGTSEYIMGTDAQGRDLLSTMIYGMRISITIGVFAVLLQAFLGIVIGLISGYFGGKLDSFFMRMADVQLSFSYLMVAIFMSAVLQAAIGSATPPFGCDIFTAIAVFKRPYFQVIKKTPVFIAMLLVVSALLIFFPDVALFLRDLAYGY